MFERKGFDFVMINSRPRVCQEVDGRNFHGQKLRPRYSLDLTTKDLPKTGMPGISPILQCKLVPEISFGRPSPTA